MKYHRQLQNTNSPKKIDRMLKHLREALQPALLDIAATNPDGSPKPSRPYTAFFKDRANIPFVREILTDITTGLSLFPGQGYEGTVDGSPVIYSITKPGKVHANLNGKMWDLWDYYLAKPKATAVYLKNTPYIFLFPYFWEAVPPNIYGDVPPAPVGDAPASNCLTVNAVLNKFSLNDGLHWGGNLIQWRMWLLMEELAHHYLDGKKNKSNDVQNANLLFRLSVKDSLETVQAYMYYAASIYGQCKDFPTHNRGHEFLETDASSDQPAADETAGPRDPVVLNATDVQFLPTGPE
ncbi:MAG: hypothetical protein Q9170_002964 [Blastenia crenularia]